VIYSVANGDDDDDDDNDALWVIADYCGLCTAIICNYDTGS